MKKLWTLAGTLLLAGGVALAQGGTASPSPSPTAGQSTIIRGCLKGSNGDYRLSSSGSTYHLSGNTGDLAANVDKTVELTGINKSDQAAAGGQQPNQMDFEVQSVSMISDKCESNVGQTPDTQGMTSAQQSSNEAGPTGSSTQPANPSDLPSPNPSATSNSNTNTTTPPPQTQSSLGTSSTGTSADTSSQPPTGMQSNNTAASSTTQPSSTASSTSDMNAPNSTQSSASTSSTTPDTSSANQSASTSQSNPQSMNNPTASETNAQTANPTGETSATSSTAPAAATTPNPSESVAAPAAGQSASSGTSASESAQGTETASADQGKKNGALPQTASPLPVLGLLGFGSLAGGLIARFRK